MSVTALAQCVDTVVNDVLELRVKESDRVATIIEGLAPGFERDLETLCGS